MKLQAVWVPFQNTEWRDKSRPVASKTFDQLSGGAPYPQVRFGLQPQIDRFEHFTPPAEIPTKELIVSGITVVDPNTGKVVAKIGPTAEGTGALSLYGSEGDLAKPQASLTGTKNGGALQLTDQNGSPTLTAGRLAYNQSPELNLFSPNTGRPLVTLTEEPSVAGRGPTGRGLVALSGGDKDKPGAGFMVRQGLLGARGELRPVKITTNRQATPAEALVAYNSISPFARRTSPVPPMYSAR